MINNIAGKVTALVLKTAIAGALIFWLVWSKRLDLTVLSKASFGGFTVSVMVAGVAAVFLGQFLLAARLLLLLRTFQLNVSFTRILGLTMIGSFTGIALPGFIGGDVVKAVYLFGDAAGRRSHVLGPLILDRAIGLYSLYLLATIALAVAAGVGMVSLGTPVLLIAPALMLAMTAVGCILAWPWTEHFAFMRAISDRIPSKIRNLGKAIHICLRRPGIMVLATVLSLVNHMLVIFTFIAAGILLNDALPPLMHLVLDPLVSVLNMVGLTPGGLGLTEGAFSLLYQHMGSDQGAAIGLIGRLLQYATFVLGGSASMLLVRTRKEIISMQLQETAANLSARH